MNREELDAVVNHPSHYNSHPSGVEVIRITEHMTFCLGNAVKYILRADHKGDALTDLHKAEWYIQREIKRIELEQREQTMDDLFSTNVPIRVLKEAAIDRHKAVLISGIDVEHQRGAE